MLFRVAVGAGASESAGAPGALMITPNTAAKLRHIRAAGLSRVRRAAIRGGIQTVDRDFKVLRDIANGSTAQAAEKSHIAESSARAILARYDAIALGLLAREYPQGGGERDGET